MPASLFACRNFWHHRSLDPTPGTPLKIPSLAATAAGLLALALCLPARASIDYSDLWWNEAESGWGVGLQRQGDVIFLTLFVYGADGAGTWFVAPDVRLLDASGAASSWHGPLYRANGPGLAATFDAAAVESSPVGTAALEFADAEAGVLRYTVDGATVAKAITRMTWRAPSPEGRYHGGYSAQVEQCADTQRIGANQFLGDMTVTRAGGLVTAQITSTRAGLPSTCTFTATDRHAGRLATWQGTFNCTLVIGHDDRAENVQRVTRKGPFTLARIATGESGFHGALAAADQDCAFSGHFGGTRQP